MTMMKLIIVVQILILLLTGCSHNATHTLTPIEVTSPDKSLVVIFTLNEAGSPVYTLKKDGAVVLYPSSLGVVLNGKDLSKNLTLPKADKPRFVSDSYDMKQGKRRHITYSANEQTFRLKHADGTALEIIFRVANDGAAFRYRFPGKSTTPVRVDNELTSFAFPKTARACLQPIAVAQTGWSNTNPSYEEHYKMEIPVGTVSPSPAGWVFPALFQTDKNWVLISEAGMDGRYHASRLQANSPNGEYRIGYPMEAEVFTGGALKAQSPLPFHSPWRIVVVGDLGTIVESTLGTDFVEPPADRDWAWVQPGTASWSWALLKDASVNYDTQKQFIDYAADMGWSYTLVDADWDRNIGYDKIAELAAYAAQKNVGLLLWYNSSGDWNKTTYSPKGALLTRETRRREFARLQSMGIKGVKIDFFAGDGQSMMAYYRDLLTDAADFGLLVNFHGATLPRGMQRTYPNLMTMESVHGFEMISFNQGSADVAASHMAMLPFTRNAFDPMDFTPTVFSAIPNIEKRTDNGFELALPVLFLSGIQHIAETADGMAQVPDYVKDFMGEVPVLWDETRFIDGYPGEFVAIARRRGSTWYVAAINGGRETITLNADLSFVDKQQGELITGGNESGTFLKQTVMGSSSVPLEIKPNGGLVITFKQKQP